MKIIQLLVCLILVITGIPLSGCNILHKDYKTIAVNSELCNFTLEYSKRYNLYGPIIDLDRIIPYVDIILSLPDRKEVAEIFDANTGKTKTVTGYRSPGGISIEVYNPNQSDTAPQTAKERMERTIEGNASWANFQLLERKPTELSGKQGELIVYLVDSLMPIPRKDGKNLEYVKALYLDYNGLIWVIEANYAQDMIDRANTDFDHIVETFQILN